MGKVSPVLNDKIRRAEVGCSATKAASPATQKNQLLFFLDENAEEENKGKTQSL